MKVMVDQYIQTPPETSQVPDVSSEFPNATEAGVAM